MFFLIFPKKYPNKKFSQEKIGWNIGDIWIFGVTYEGEIIFGNWNKNDSSVGICVWIAGMVL